MDTITREHIATQIAELRNKQRRMPAHWVERREQISDQIDALITDWLAAE